MAVNMLAGNIISSTMSEVGSGLSNGMLVFMLALALLAGVCFGKLAKAARLPSVTGYLLAGIIFGPNLLGSLSAGSMTFGLSSEFLATINIIYTVSFCFICFSLGVEIKPKKIFTLGHKAAAISFTQSVAAAVLTGGVLVLISVASKGEVLSIEVALLLGALAAASAPTAKYMITRQYRAEGEITDMMIPVAALDDVFGIIFFSIVVSVLPAFSGGVVSVYSLLLAPLIEVFASIAIGVILGVILGYATKIFKIQPARVVVCIAFVLLAASAAEIFNEANLYLIPAKAEGHIRLSSLLITIVMGGAFSFVNQEHGIRKRLDSWTYPMFIVFFVLAGARVRLSDFMLPLVLLVSVIYIIVRFIGKYFGSYAGSAMMGESKNMRKYLGVTLLPQADVVIGLAAMAADVLLDMQGVVFIAAVVFEIIGHVLIRICLKKAGEIHGDIDSVTIRFRRSKIRDKKVIRKSVDDIQPEIKENE